MTTALLTIRERKCQKKRHLKGCLLYTSSLIYINGCYEGGSESYNKYYKEINTKGLTIDDIKLQLEVERTKDIRFIKNAVIVLAVGIIITLILTLLI